MVLKDCAKIYKRNFVITETVKIGNNMNHFLGEKTQNKTTNN